MNRMLADRLLVTNVAYLSQSIAGASYSALFRESLWYRQRTAHLALAGPVPVASCLGAVNRSRPFGAGESRPKHQQRYS